MPLEDKRWLQFAKEDMRMAELALEDGVFNQVCFHAQQAVEKMLKALLAEQGRVIPKTHKVIDLVQLLPHVEFGDLKQDVILLDRFYIPTRYPDALPGMLPEGLPNKNDAASALSTAGSLHAFIQALQTGEQAQSTKVKN